MALLVVVGLIYSLQSATRGRLMSQCMIFNIVPKQTPAREKIRGTNAFVKNCQRTAARIKVNFGWIQFYWCHVYYNHGCLTEPEPSEMKKKRERERKLWHREPLCLPRLWLTFTLDGVPVDDSGAPQYHCASVQVSLEWNACCEVLLQCSGSILHVPA